MYRRRAVQFEEQRRERVLGLLVRTAREAELRVEVGGHAGRPL
jgi:hypothetical protein